MATTSSASSPCASCIGTCCRKPWAIGVRLEEAARFGGFVIPNPTLGPAFAGELRRRADGACIFLRGYRCSIYGRRPQVCRDFAAETCGMHVARAGFVSGAGLPHVERPSRDRA